MTTETFIQAVKFATEVRHPLAYASIGLIVAYGMILGAARIASIRRKRWQVLVCAVFIVCVSATPAVLQGLARIKGVYHVRVVTLGPDQLPRVTAHVTSSVGGEPKQVSGGWEFDIPPQTVPADGVVWFFASVESEFLNGAKVTNVKESGSYYQTLILNLTRDTSAAVSGIVVDRRGRAVSDAKVSVIGQQNATRTDSVGYFSVSAHAPTGQMVNIHVEKGNSVSNVSEPAGSSSIQILLPIPD